MLYKIRGKDTSIFEKCRVFSTKFQKLPIRTNIVNRRCVIRRVPREFRAVNREYQRGYLIIGAISFLKYAVFAAFLAFCRVSVLSGYKLHARDKILP